MKWLLPPLLWAVCLVATVALGVLAPLAAIMPAPYQWFGVAPVLFGAWLLASASGRFHRVKTNINTFRDPNVLVTDGPFAITRNPMYLGFALVLLGAALIANAWSALAPALVFFLVANAWYIPFEERAASAQFGDAYVSYRQRVRRWV
jgi:protein-S-isoprenylcysteine O-methyltransferase Ste14